MSEVRLPLLSLKSQCDWKWVLCGLNQNILTSVVVQDGWLSRAAYTEAKLAATVQLGNPGVLKQVFSQM